LQWNILREGTRNLESVIGREQENRSQNLVQCWLVGNMRPVVSVLEQNRKSGGQWIGGGWKDEVSNWGTENLMSVIGTENLESVGDRKPGIIDRSFESVHFVVFWHLYNKNIKVKTWFIMFASRVHFRFK
jgi:hypothetical protein